MMLSVSRYSSKNLNSSILDLVLPSGIFPLKNLGTVAELTEHFTQNDFSKARKKTQTMRALSRLSDAAFGKSGK